ncbi:hypothetical protein ACFPJ4_15315 [Lysinimonas soli]|uniref:IPTL-CTERM sorting domain-containing protein n=1 Tax=Lysinimonas soli TaxID=1074233 RepID=A0ABW0NVN0_9MICO
MGTQTIHRAPRHRAPRIAVALTTAALASAALFAGPDAARADSPSVQFSADGIHWASDYSGQLFAGVLMVPGSIATRSVYVRNAATGSGLLRVTLSRVATDDLALADATSITTSSDARPGAPVPLSAAQPCAALADGQLVGSGAAVRLDNAIAVSSLDGTAGQSGWVAFELRVTFRSTDSAAPAPADCPSDGASVGGLPAPRDSSTGPTPYHRTARGWAAGSGSVSIPQAPVTTGHAQPPRDVGFLVANTERFFQEYTVEFWIAMWVLGTLLFLLVRRRRAARDTPETKLRQIGMDR